MILIMQITRTFDLLDRYQEKFPGKNDALASRKNNKWVKISTEEYIRNSYLFSYGLLAHGFKKGDKIITVTNNRPAWNIVDMGMTMIGVVHVPVFPSLNVTEYAYILMHSDAKFVIVSDDQLYLKLKGAAETSGQKMSFFSFEDLPNIKSWKEIIELGKENEGKYKEEVERAKKEIKPGDLAAIIYTSGTTGIAKGVMLSHKNLVTNFLAAAEIFQLAPDNRYLSILPLCHVGGRLGNYQTQYSGCSIYYAENMGTIAADMKDIQADGFDAVPRILEKIIDTVIAKGRKIKGIKNKIFFWAVRLGFDYKTDDESSWFYKRKLKLADKLIFSKWREALGGKTRLVGCGGASLQPRIERIFWAAGIKVINMYGLTETSPIMTINRKEKPDLKLGSVGATIEGVEVKIADDGEILCRGNNVMLGYYKDPELTKTVFDEEGWFHTGDIGAWEDDKFLKVTDRKKEIFKLSNGKFVAPQIIENRFKESVLIDQIMVVGEHEKFASALISPNFTNLQQWCEKENISTKDRNELIRHPMVLKIYSNEVNRLNRLLSDPERIVKYKLISDEWSPATGELSPTLKLRRKFISEKYQAVLEEVYQKRL
jgi:long-chain acyl-CoA synthetase